MEPGHCGCCTGGRKGPDNIWAYAFARNRVDEGLARQMSSRGTDAIVVVVQFASITCSS